MYFLANSSAYLILMAVPKTAPLIRNIYYIHVYLSYGAEIRYGAPLQYI